MPTNIIPNFIEQMGHHVLSYVLNIDENQALEVINGQFDLDANRTEVLNSFIQICRQLRIQGIDQRDIDFSMYSKLPQILHNNTHIFNAWHKQLGGEQPPVTNTDPTVASASKIALEVYPLFLIKTPPSHYFFTQTFSHISILIYNLDERQVLMDAVMEDASLAKLFSKAGEDEMGACCYYMSSTGRGGSLQLSVFPSTLIANAFELMKMRGIISKEALLNSVTETIEMLRNIAEGTQIEVPAFVGFHNVGLDDSTEIDIENGKIRAYNEEILSLIPNDARPTIQSGENKTLGLILEYKYPYTAIIGEHNYWPPELDQAREKLETAQENLSLTLALAINRIPAVGINHAWSLAFDPLCQGTSISWNRSAQSPMPYYFLKANDVTAIKYWSKLVNNRNDEKIRLAIRRVLSSINNRLNPIDGFIDTIIAWENLFGGNAELSYRISVSIAKLLAPTLEDRLELQTKIVKYYNDRSHIVHGVQETTHEIAIQKRDECIQITLDALRRLYEEYHDLLLDPERSKKMALL